ncbi:alpha 1,2-mannosyltransferase 2.4.1, partial [Nowakowskiella sp. JEL0078]
MLTNTPRKPSFQTILTYTLTLIIVILLVFILRSFIVPSNEFFQSATIYRKPPESFRLKLKIFNHQLLSSNAYDGANKLPDPWLSRGRIVSSGTSHSNLENYEFGVAKSLSKRKRRINKLSSQLGNTFAKIQHDAKRFEVQTTTNLRKVAKLKDLPEKISYVPLPKDQEIGWEWVPDVESTAIPDTLKKSISLPSENHKKLIYDTIEFIEKLPLDQLKQIQNMAADLHQKNQPIISQNPPVQNIPPSNDWPVDMLTIIPSTPPHKRESAAILVLCQNKDLESLLQSLRMFEDRFNRRFRYPYVILNDQPFNDVFKTRVTALVSSPVEFGGLVPGTWEYPTHINKTVADLCRERMARDGVMYGGSESYRHMCRWYSGWFFRHPLLEKFEWYWRLEPGVSFYCDVTYDPFVFLRLQNKVYGFNIALLEIRDTIPSLWALTRYFAIEQGIDNSTLLAFLADETGDYNGCHFWSNFEIARLDVWRSPGYLKYFEYLDKWGGFYYE